MASRAVSRGRKKRAPIAFTASHILNTSNRFKMSGIDASRVTAEMIKVKTIRNCVAAERVRVAMSTEVAALAICYSTERTIPFAGLTAHPEPTGRAVPEGTVLIDLRPES
jgi:hypothetical protein